MDTERAMRETRRPPLIEWIKQQYRDGRHDVPHPAATYLDHLASMTQEELRTLWRQVWPAVSDGD